MTDGITPDDLIVDDLLLSARESYGPECNCNTGQYKRDALHSVETLKASVSESRKHLRNTTISYRQTERLIADLAKQGTEMETVIESVDQMLSRVDTADIEEVRSYLENQGPYHITPTASDHDIRDRALAYCMELSDDLKEQKREHGLQVSIASKKLSKFEKLRSSLEKDLEAQEKYMNSDEFKRLEIEAVQSTPEEGLLGRIVSYFTN